MGKTIIGRRFGFLVAEDFLEQEGYIRRSDNIVICRCNCGGKINVPLGYLLNGIVGNCGCVKKRGKQK